MIGVELKSTVITQVRSCFGIGEPKVRPCFGIGPCIGRGRNMYWEVSENPKYDRVFVSDQVEHVLGPIPKPVPRHVSSRLVSVVNCLINYVINVT